MVRKDFISPISTMRIRIVEHAASRKRAASPAAPGAGITVSFYVNGQLIDRSRVPMARAEKFIECLASKGYREIAPGTKLPKAL